MTSQDVPNVTIHDVARAAGVAASTASRALSGAPIGERGREVADHVLRVAAELGYFPNHAARALRGRRTSVIVLADDPSNSTTGAVIEAMQDLAQVRGGFFVSSAAIGSTADAQLETVRLIVSLRPLAIVVSSTRLSDSAVSLHVADLLRGYREAGGRVVVIGTLPLAGPTVLLDNRAAGVETGRHAAALGRRRYAILAGERDRPVFTDRTEGFLEALDEIGVPRRDVAVEHCAHTHEGGASAMQRLLEGEQPPDAVLVVNDKIAFGAVAALRAAGVRVPEDVALASIDDDPLARDLTPPLTSYAFPFDEVGVRVAELALGVGDETLTVSGALVIRTSTGGAGGAEA